MKLTKDELTTLIQVLNQPRQMDLQTANVLLQLNNKLHQMVDELNLPPKEKDKK